MRRQHPTYTVYTVATMDKSETLEPAQEISNEANNLPK